MRTYHKNYKGNFITSRVREALDFPKGEMFAWSQRSLSSLLSSASLISCSTNMKEYRNGFGVAYRELQQTAENLEALWEKGETRLSPEEIKWRLEALKELKQLHHKISATLEKCSQHCTASGSHRTKRKNYKLIKLTCPSKTFLTS